LSKKGGNFMPAQNRKLIYHVAVTLDGFIADASGQFPLAQMEGEHVTEYVASLQQDYDTVLMGRRTYDLALSAGVVDPYPFLSTYVFSRTLPASTSERVNVIGDGLLDVARELKAKPGKDIYLCGGGQLASQLLDAGLVDEVWLKLNPLLYGNGLGLAPTLSQPRGLQLLDCKRYATGVVLLKYALAVNGDPQQP
jgi:dihydrofolate reductase